MGCHIDLALIFCDNRRACEGQQWVFHSTVRERGRQDQNIIITPDIRCQEGFCRIQKRVQRGKHVCDEIELFRFGVDASTVTDFLEIDVSDGQSDQITRNRYIIFKGIRG